MIQVHQQPGSAVQHYGNDTDFQQSVMAVFCFGKLTIYLLDVRDTKKKKMHEINTASGTS